MTLKIIDKHSFERRTLLRLKKLDNGFILHLRDFKAEISLKYCVKFFVKICLDNINEHSLTDLFQKYHVKYSLASHIINP